MCTYILTYTHKILTFTFICVWCILKTIVHINTSNSINYHRVHTGFLPLHICNSHLWRWETWLALFLLYLLIWSTIPLPYVTDFLSPLRIPLIRRDPLHPAWDLTPTPDHTPHGCLSHLNLALTSRARFSFVKMLLPSCLCFNSGAGCPSPFALLLLTDTLLPSTQNSFIL